MKSNYTEMGLRINRGQGTQGPAEVVNQGAAIALTVA